MTEGGNTIVTDGLAVTAGGASVGDGILSVTDTTDAHTMTVNPTSASFSSTAITVKTTKSR